jgi:REP element-mobilizing transposase RayT
MPRSARLDAPGVLHHVIIRGIERRNIFNDNRDRVDLLDRLAVLLPETQTDCYAWALMPNHAHFLFRSGPDGLPVLMRRLLTGYVVTFNLRHHRHGQMFQNRYKSIICQEDLYLKELVRYIHLNPLRGQLVPDCDELARYPFCGHGVLLATWACEWQNVDYVLGYFGKTAREARNRYRQFVERGIAQGRREDLVGGGLIRSLGGWAEVKKKRRGAERIKGDERILGEGHFVDAILAEARENFERKYAVRRQGYSLKKLAEAVADIYGVAPQHIYEKGRQPKRVEARSVLCYWAVRNLGMSLTELARRLELTVSAVGYAVARGRRIAKQKKYRLENMQ